MPLASYRLDGITVKLGKHPARHDPRTLQLAKYLAASTLPPPPARMDYGAKVKQWPMMNNDTIGDCTCAAAGHMIEQWTTYASDTVTPADGAIIAAYSAVSGYDPKTGANDNGAVLLDVLNYWRKTGVDGHQIEAYTALEPKNHIDMMESINLFGNCYIGVQLPVSAQHQAVWAVPPGGPVGTGAPGSWGGHCVPVVAYDHRGLTVITWGAPKRMTWGFLDTYGDEAYAVLSMDWIDRATHIAPSHFDFTALKQDLQQIDKAAAMTA